MNRTRIGLSAEDIKIPYQHKHADGCGINIYLFKENIMYTLGINAVFHDSSACLIKDGQLIAAAEDERFTHIKHGKRPVPFSTWELPYHAIDYCLSVADIHINDIDHFAYSFDPYILLKQEHIDKQMLSLPLQPSAHPLPEEWMSVWDPLFLSYIVNAPRLLKDGWPHHLQQRFIGANRIQERWHFVPHHLSHAASAFIPSPYFKSAIMTIDGRGEKATTSYYVADGKKIDLLQQVNMPHSMGLLYESVTAHLGFLNSSDEYKVMALASYGKPALAHFFRDIIRVKSDGSFTIEDVKLQEHLGAKRLKGEEFTQHHFNVAHSLQLVLQEKVLELTEWLFKKTQLENLCLAGGVALNCVLNAYLLEHGPFKNIWIQPAAGDAGTSLGAALVVDQQQRDSASKTFIMEHVYWGPSYEDEDIERFLQWTKTPYRKLSNIAEETADLLAQDKIIGWFQGRMEYGPRALGSRSILASPATASMQSKLNNIKDREDFRPVAPVVIEEDVSDWFETSAPSPFMLFVFKVKENKAELIPAVRHVDGTARIQTINRQQHALYYDLLKAFKQKTGIPVLINTSFNTLGKPIVCSPRDAIECFWTSPFDALVMGSFLLEKESTTTRSKEKLVKEDTLVH
jgi:carbamoyltransferase